MITSNELSYKNNLKITLHGGRSIADLCDPNKFE